MDYQVHHNTDLRRFEIASDAALSYIAYELFEGGIAFISERIPQQLQGRGIGSYLAEFVLNYAQSHHLKVKPQCAFVRWYVDQHPQYWQNSLFHATRQDNGKEKM